MVVVSAGVRVLLRAPALFWSLVGKATVLLWWADDSLVREECLQSAGSAEVPGVWLRKDEGGVQSSRFEGPYSREETKYVCRALI